MRVTLVCVLIYYRVVFSGVNVLWFMRTPSEGQAVQVILYNLFHELRQDLL